MRKRKIAFQANRLLIIMFLFIVGTLSTLAQTLKGKVVDSRTQEPIIGAVVSIKGDKGSVAGATTDVDGNFAIQVKKTPAVIVVSYTGYNKEEVEVYEVTDDAIQIDLKEDFNGLGEVVVIGYGSQKKEDLSGAVASLKVSDIPQANNASVNNLLEGKISGLQVTPTSGQPGAGVSLRIRGGSSVQGGNEPLYVIDGFPIYNENISSGVFSSNNFTIHESVDPLSAINPGDIESVTVLKDASATAIYGSRGANGVVIITTKKGKAGEKAQITYDGSVGFQKLRKKYDVLNATEFASLRNDALYDSNPSGGRYQYKSQDEVNALGAGTDWQDLAYHSGITTNHQLSISGGTDKTHYAISGNYYDQDGILRNTGFNRIGARVNLDSKVSSHLLVGINLSATKTATKTPANGLVYGLLQAPSTATAYDADGSFTYQNPFELTFSNPLATLLEQTNKSRTYRLLGTAYGEYEFIKNLKLKVQFGADVNSTKDYYYVPSTLYEGASNGGTASLGHVDARSWINENTLSYTTSINKVHNVDFLLGFTQQENKYEIVRTGSYGFVSDALSYNSLQSGNNYSTPYSYTATNSLISYLGRVNYNYAERHYLSLSIRRDGSSRFGTDRKWGTFPSVGYSWNAINEEFLKLYKKVLSNLKVRLSYGKTGNQEIGNYQSLSTLSTKNYVIGNQLLVGYAPDRIANNDLGWESTAQFDAGVDLGFFRNRLNLTVDYYHKKTSDLLLDVSIPFTSGYGTSLQNYGTVVNHGFEITIDSHNFINKFKWDTSFNISFNRNKVTDLGGTSSSYITTTATNWYTTYIIQEGQPLGSFYGAVYDGVLQEGEESAKGALTYNQSAKAGDRVYKDINGDGKFTNSEDRKVIGNAQPDFIFGMTNNFSYKNFDLSIFINGSYGNDIINVTRERLSLFNGLNNAIGEARDRWTVDRPSKTVPRAKYDPAPVFSTEFVEDGSYIRLKNITLGYTFPKRWVKAIGISGLRLYATATNLWTITDYTGYDPEVTSADNALTAGTDFAVYPSAKTYNFGVQVNF